MEFLETNLTPLNALLIAMQRPADAQMSHKEIPNSIGPLKVCQKLY